MPRKRNPRRVLLPQLRYMKNNLLIMISTWNQSQTSYDWNAPRVFGENLKRIPIPDSEKVELKIDEWERLITYMSYVQDQAAHVKDYAARQIEVLKGRTV
jgi:hypothetical protein